MANLNNEPDDDDAIKMSMLESRFVNDEFDNKNDDYESDNEYEMSGPTAPLPPCSAAIPYRRFGQENILEERTAHTPPTLWTRGPDDEPDDTTWPKRDDHNRNCHSAPPACSPMIPKKPKISFNVVEQPIAVDFTYNNTSFQMNRPVEIEDAERFGTAKSLSTLSHATTSSLANFNDLARLPASALFPLDNFKHINNTSVGEFLATECRSFYCELCEKKFRKESDLNLHKQTHLIEQLNARTRAYQCPECRTIQRSKALLVKHLEVAHNKTELTLELDKASRTSISEEVDPETSTSNASLLNVRRYWCSDCEVGFRTHGVLSKHLRSKNHVKTLVQQKKLPEDSLGLVKDYASQLIQIDTTDCEQARKTLISKLTTFYKKY